ncbi:hypothetical protein QYF36_026163 [Acer negundo]|nr:hypothetical protein QYF36_026163 [Acer negundo]
MEVKERADEESRRLGQIWEEKEYKEALEAFNEKNIASYGINGGDAVESMVEHLFGNDSHSVLSEFQYHR